MDDISCMAWYGMVCFGMALEEIEWEGMVQDAWDAILMLACGIVGKDFFEPNLFSGSACFKSKRNLLIIF